MSLVCQSQGVWTVVIDTVSGQELARVQSFGKVSADGLSVITRDGSSSGADVRRYDVATGRLRVQVANPGFDVVIDTDRGDVLTYLRRVDGLTLFLFDAQTLTPLWSLAASNALYPTTGSEPAFAPTAPYIVAAGGVPAEISVVDTIMRQVVLRAPLPTSEAIAVAFGPPAPWAPTSLASTVDGRAVTLSWSAGGPPAAISRYVLEIGSAPGLSDIFSVLDVGLQTSFSASAVPPGRYYVRVRAGNYTGLSAPSNEVVVQVP